MKKTVDAQNFPGFAGIDDYLPTAFRLRTFVEKKG